MIETPEPTIVVGQEETPVLGQATKKRPPTGPRWETDALERVKTGVRRFAKPLTDLVSRDANEGGGPGSRA